MLRKIIKCSHKLIFVLAILVLFTCCYRQADITIKIEEKQKRKLITEITAHLEYKEGSNTTDSVFKNFIDNDLIDIKRKLRSAFVEIDYVNIKKYKNEIVLNSRFSLKKDHPVAALLSNMSDINEETESICPLVLFDGNRIVFEYPLKKVVNTDLSNTKSVMNSNVKISFTSKTVPKRAFMVYVVNAREIRKKIIIEENRNGAILEFSPEKIREEIKDRFWIVVEWV